MGVQWGAGGWVQGVGRGRAKAARPADHNAGTRAVEQPAPAERPPSFACPLHYHPTPTPLTQGSLPPRLVHQRLQGDLVKIKQRLLRHRLQPQQPAGGAGWVGGRVESERSRVGG